MTALMPIQTTARLLMTRSKAEDLTFDAEDLILFRSESPSFSKQTKEYLTALVRDAQRVAHANYISNVLVGLSDEGGESGDVGIWLGPGDYGQGKEANTLTALGLPEGWIERLKYQQEPDFVKQLNTSLLEGQYCFSVEARPYVFFFYLGKFEDGWGGLASVGIWT